MPTAIETLAAARSALVDALQQPATAPTTAGPSPTARQITAMYDAYFQAQWPDTAALPSACCLVAVGGYGREESSLHADIDVLLVFTDAVPKGADELAGALFRPLWDLQLDVGHGVRSVADCVDMARYDMAVLASLLDIRHIAGDTTVSTALQDAMKTLVTPEVLPGFLSWLERERAGRLSRHGNAFALLEPHLKAGIGGLREAHGARWLHRFLNTASSLDAPALARLEDGVGLLLETRSRLHALCGSRQDAIPLELLPELAMRCGFCDADGPDTFLAVLHRAMEYHRAVADAQQLAAAGTHLQEFSNPWPALQHSAQTGLPISLATRRALEQLDPVPDHEAYRRLAALLAAPHASVAMEALLETGALATLLPAFGISQDRIPFGGWHIYPVGRHSVETLRRLETLQMEDGDTPLRLCRLWRQESMPEALRWAALLHDVGKTPADGSQGHEARGAAMAASMLQAWGAPELLVEEVRFLIAEHLVLAETAHAEDPSDDAVVSRTAGTVATADRLHRLLLLTYADSRATGPRVWNDWSASLLFTLVDAVSEAVAASDLSPARAVRELLKRRDAIRVLGSDRYDAAMLEQRLEGLDSRYLLAMSPRRVVAHLQLQDEYAKALAEARIRLPGSGQAARVALLEARPAGRRSHAAWEVDVVGSRDARLLAVASGVLSLHGLDIMQADVFTWPNRDGDSFVLHRFFVSPPPDPLYPDAFWTRVRSSLTYALSGKVHLHERLAEKRQSLLAAETTTAPPLATAREEDGALRVEVEADDRIGLLHDIVVSLEAAHAEVQVARIQTRGRRAHDHFHVQSRAGHTMVADALVSSVLQALR